MSISPYYSLMRSGLDLAGRGLDRAYRAATNLMDPENGDVGEAMVGLSLSRFEVRLGAKLVRLADDNLGSLLDILA